MTLDRSWLKADWNAPSGIRAGITTRLGGISPPPYDNLNMALHVGDDSPAVMQNRTAISHMLSLPAEPCWIEQVHGNRIVEAVPGKPAEADGIYTGHPGVVCVIMTADCVPMLLCDKNGRRIAAIHVGWRGLCAGIVTRALDPFRESTGDVIVWIGPHIQADNYEVGEDVYHTCLDRNTRFRTAFVKNNNKRWNASLKAMIIEELKTASVEQVYCSNLCTYRDESLFFSYRRDNVTGRMASMIWMEQSGSDSPHN